MKGTRNMQMKFNKLAIMGVALVALAGCQSNGDTAKSSAKNEQPEMVINAPGTPLGGGFTAGMTPQTTCDVFNKYYKTKMRNNLLCRKLRQKKNNDYTNATIINSNIKSIVNDNQDVSTMVFVFNEKGTLNYVTALDRNAAVKLERANSLNQRQDSVIKNHY
jgi:hypothetical protein